MASASFEKECEKYFGSSCLYTVLGLEKNEHLTFKQVRLAYYNAALLHHPDRCKNAKKSEATAKFQIVSKAFAVLGDDEKRDVYFKTGRVDENDFCEEKCWLKYWRSFFKEITGTLLKPFFKIYKAISLITKTKHDTRSFKGYFPLVDSETEYCAEERSQTAVQSSSQTGSLQQCASSIYVDNLRSSEELLDVKKAYVKYKGDMNSIMESLIMAEIEEEPRYRRIIDKLIADHEVEKYEDYANEPPDKAKCRRAKWIREHKEFEKSCRENNPGTNFASLPELIDARKRDYDAGVFDILEEKYRKVAQSKAGPSLDSTERFDGEALPRQKSGKAKFEGQTNHPVVKKKKLVKTEIFQVESNHFMDNGSVGEGTNRHKKTRPIREASKEESRNDFLSRAHNAVHRSHPNAVVNTRHRERTARSELKAQKSPQHRNKAKTNGEGPVPNGIVESAERKRKMKAKHRGESRDGQEAQAKEERSAKSIRKSRKEKAKKKSADRKRPTVKTELQNGCSESPEEAKRMKLTTKKKRTNHAGEPACSTSVHHKKKGMLAQAAGQDVYDGSNHVSNIEMPATDHDQALNLHYRRSKRKKKWKVQSFANHVDVY